MGVVFLGWGGLRGFVLGFFLWVCWFFGVFLLGRFRFFGAVCRWGVMGVRVRLCAFFYCYLV